MRSRNRRQTRARLVFILIFLGLLLYGGVQIFPYCYAILKGQYYINPRVQTRSDEVYQLELWVKLPSLPNQAPVREKLEQIISSFTAAHPNFQVNTTYLPEVQAMERLQLALEKGTPPDLFFHADSSQTYYGDLQIPLEIYLTKEEKLAWPEGVWKQAIIDKQVYALPVALYPRIMLVNSELWQPTTCSHSDVLANGWTWEQFLQCIAEVKQEKVYGFVPTSVGDAFFAGMLAAWGEPKLLHHDGEPTWSAEQLLQLAEAWLQLSQNPAVPSPPTQMDRDCLALFLNKRAAAIGPVNHHLAKWLWEKSLQVGITPSIWPLPNQTGHSDLRGIYLVAFRQADYKGHRHTKATAQLAHYLAPELALLLQEFAYAVPAQLSLLDRLDLPYTAESLAVYADVAKALPTSYSYGPEPGMAEKHWQHTIAPAWDRFVQGEWTAQEFAEGILLDLARATIAGP